MGGTSTSNQQSSTAGTTAPWLAAQPMLQSILGQVSGGVNNTGLTGAETGALGTLENNAGTASQYAPQISANANSLLAGGGALNQAGAVNQNYQNYQAAMQPLASNTNYNPYNTPGFSNAIGTMTSDIANGVNGQFAAAGRDFSGMNTQTLARGIAQGVAPTIASQYNANVANQQGAAGNLYAAGNTTANTQAGMQTQANANTQAGTQAATDANTAANAGANATLQAEAARRGIPVQALGLLAQIGIPIAGLGSQSTGSGTTNTQGTMSGAQQFGTIMSGIGSLIPRGNITGNNFNF